jgi:hypothetical protein
MRRVARCATDRCPYGDERVFCYGGAPVSCFPAGVAALYYWVICLILGSSAKPVWKQDFPDMSPSGGN